ncbi:MAG TPA: hypothetical protein VF376_03345 [Thermoanaerobaculia bacterium]
MPAAFIGGGERFERLREAAPGAREIRGRPGASEENGDVVEKPAPFGIGIEAKLWNQVPEIIRERSGDVALALPNLFQKTEPVSERSGRPAAKAIAPACPKRFEPIDLRYFFFFSGVGVKVTAGEYSWSS